MNVKGTKIKLYRDLAIMITVILVLSIFLFQRLDLLSWKSILLMFAILVPVVNAVIIVYHLIKIKKGKEVNW